MPECQRLASPVSNAFICTTKGRLKSGFQCTGSQVRASFSCWNNRSLMGTTMQPKWENCTVSGDWYCWRLSSLWYLEPVPLASIPYSSEVYGGYEGHLLREDDKLSHLFKPLEVIAQMSFGTTTIGLDQGLEDSSMIPFCIIRLNSALIAWWRASCTL